MSGDHPNYSIVENGLNTKKSHGDLTRLAVTQTPVKDHQLKTDVKNSQRVSNNNNNNNTHATDNLTTAVQPTKPSLDSEVKYGFSTNASL